jgi:hypothetical protein
MMEQTGRPVPEWVLGGGTGLMVWADHRLSKDIDAFISDPQYIPILSPRVSGEEIWHCLDYVEASHYLKLNFAEGEIDFIVSPTVTDILAQDLELLASDEFTRQVIRVEHPVEIAIKKLYHRGTAMTVRDAFDICVVDCLHRDQLRANLVTVSNSRNAILLAVERFRQPFFSQYLFELNIRPKWQKTAETAFYRIREIVAAIPVA